MLYIYVMILDRVDAFCHSEVPVQPSLVAVWLTIGYTTGSMLICSSEAGCARVGSNY